MIHPEAVRLREGCQRQTQAMVAPEKIITWVVVKIMAPFWVLNLIRHLIFMETLNPKP